MDALFSAFDGDEELVDGDDLAQQSNTGSDKDQTAKRQRAGSGAADDDEVISKKPKMEESLLHSNQNDGHKLARVVSGKSNTSSSNSSDDSNKEEPNAGRPPAKTYPFVLDGFQKEAIGYLERNESVLVAAHTSAGKTVVAEYAIALALRDKQRVIYTSPIKALSNQKYRDLVEEFSDVGLMTGDVTINPNASCLVMTTEILRSMLYRGSEVVREVAYAVFDEVHYMRDRERGVVWEESIVLLPHKVRYVFLSATIPNAQQFCDWISKVHQQPCHAVYTDYRPTPLQHYVYPSGGTGVHLIVDGKGKFHEDTFQKAMSTLSSSSLQDAVQSSTSTKEGRMALAARRREKKADLMSIIQMIMQRNYDPAIVFSFSKKDCENYAKEVGKLTFNTEEEKELVTQVFTNAMDSLSADDKELPQVRSLLPLLQKGIGIHHGGLLPILKEVTEILFGEGLLKVLFATETFAMGINMPAKTVVFTAMRKYDGSDFRWVSAGEYIQMSGRAGRRGLDDRGIVIQMIEEEMEPAQAKEIMSGQADPLTSTFKLGYNMLLNLMRVEDADPEFIIRNSLHTFQQESAVPELEREATELEAQLASTIVPNEPALARYHYLLMQVAKAEDQLRSTVYTPARSTPFLKPGRLVKLGAPWNCWTVFLELEYANGAPKGKDSKQLPEAIKVVAPCAPLSDAEQQQQQRQQKQQKSSRQKSGKQASVSPVARRPFDPAVNQPSKGNKKGQNKAGRVEPDPACVTVPINLITALSSLRLNINASAAGRDPHRTRAALNDLQAVVERFPKGMPLLDPKENMKIDDPALVSLTQKYATAVNALQEDQLHSSPDVTARENNYARFMDKLNLSLRCKALRKEIKAKKQLPMKQKLAAMKVVLRRLGHVNKDGVIELKGRVGCELSTADVLVCTEMLLGGAFNGLSSPQVAAMLSCFVFGESGDDDCKLPPDMTPLHRTVQEAARRVAKVQIEAGIELDSDEFANAFRPDLMEPIHLWCTGAKFVQVCNVTDQFEGSIIRVTRRLVELLRQMCVAARVIGDATLEQIFHKAIELIKRDIIFAASLYL